MRKFIQLLIILSLFSSCATNKNYLERSDADKALQDAVKKINKNSNDEDATLAIPLLYSGITENHLGKIKSYSSSKELSRWDNIIREYDYLQDAYEVIINSAEAFKLANPVSYSTQLLETKQAAAEDYYEAGL